MKRDYLVTGGLAPREAPLGVMGTGTPIGPSLDAPSRNSTDAAMDTVAAGASLSAPGAEAAWSSGLVVGAEFTEESPDVGFFAVDFAGDFLDDAFLTDLAAFLGALSGPLS